MNGDFSRSWMWSEACEMLARAERLHREFFRPLAAGGLGTARRYLGNRREVLVLAALPAVSADRVEVAIDGDELVVAGIRVLPSALQTAVIHRLELPQGRFERRVRLPAGAYNDIRRSASDGCLLITLQKAGGYSG
jgi:HSP20 family protein